MSSGVPLYYAGIAPDEDILDNLLDGSKRRLEHGNSYTLDVRRFLNVKYQQVPIGKMKKIVGSLVIVVIFILLITLAIGSPPAHNIRTTQRLGRKNDPNDTPRNINISSSQAPSIHQAFTKRPPTQLPEMQMDLNMKCHTCALVGNSEVLSRSNAGSAIDSHECVFRLNSAPTAGFEGDVGSKTTVRVFSPVGLSKLSGKIRQTFAHRDKLKLLVLLGSKNELCKNCTVLTMFQDLAKYLQDFQFLTIARIVYQESLSGATRDAAHSSSLNAVTLMTGICQKLRVYGVRRQGSCTRGNYWGSDRTSTDCKELVTRQKMGRLLLNNEMFEKLAQKFDIEFFYPR